MTGGGYSASLAMGRVQAGEQDILGIPHDGAQGRRGVILHHGALALASWWEDATNNPKSMGVFAHLARHFVVVAGDFGGDQWGNATDVSRMDAARAVLAANGCATDKVLLAGLSMGAMSSMGYIRDKGASAVAAFVGFEPAANLNDLWTRNIFGSVRAAISAAWGTSYPGTLPGNSDPLAASTGGAAFQATLATVPGQFYYSSVDTIALPTFTTALATAVGYGATLVSTTDDHGDSLIGKINLGDVTQFLMSHAY